MGGLAGGRVTSDNTARLWVQRVGIAFLFLCFLVFLFYLLFKSDYFVIKNVNCWVEEKTSLADEKRWCEQAERQLRGQNIFLTHLTAAAGELERKFLPVGGVVVKRKYPRAVLVQIVERQPIARICPPAGQEFLIDRAGVIFSQVTQETKNLKKVVLELGEELTLGQIVGERVVLLILLEDPQIKFIEYVGRRGIETHSNEDLTVFFSREKSIQAQARSLQMIVKKYRIEGKELKSVDLRYEQPVVRY